MSFSRSFPINNSATQAFLDALQCPTSFCVRLPPSPTTSVCGPGASLAFVYCDSIGPSLWIENIALSGTINGPLFKAMGSIWTGLLLINASLSGTIPSELVRLPDLRFLRVESNKLTGTLPSEPSAPMMEDFRVTKNAVERDNSKRIPVNDAKYCTPSLWREPILGLSAGCLVVAGET